MSPASLVTTSIHLEMRLASFDDFQRAEMVDRFCERVKTYEPRVMDAALLESLRESAQRDRLTLVLGAGASRSVGLPSWPELVQALVARVFAKDDDLRQRMAVFLDGGLSDPLRQVSALEHVLALRSSLLGDVRACLYADYDPSLELQLLEPLCTHLLMSTSQVAIYNVISYNFDNTLEKCLERLGGSCTVVHDAAGYARVDRGLKVYHPHGFLPMAASAEDRSEVVFAEQDYHAQYADWAAWTNIVQLHHMNSRRCLLIGLSMSDPNMRRLLSLQKTLPRSGDDSRHTSIQKTSESKVADYFLEAQLKQFGVGVLWTRSHAEIADVIRGCFT